MADKTDSDALEWIMTHRSYPHDRWCLIWPFFRDKHGRGVLHQEGEHYAHRLMCKLVKGEPPTPGHGTAHSCGAGHLGCVNPHHLSWKTQAENLGDCAEHGTLVRHHGGNVRRVMPEEVEAIRGARGFQIQAQLAAKYGVSEGTISDIWHGRSHVGESKVPHWKPEEIEKLRAGIASGLNFTEIAKGIGRPTHAVSSKAYRMGLKSGQPATRIYARKGH